MNFPKRSSVVAALVVIMATLALLVTGITSNAQAATIACSTTLVRPGDNGPCVVELQQRLNKDGANPTVGQDGKYGPKTRTAVTQFQSKHGLKPDGWVGPLTWTALLGAAAPSGNTVVAKQPTTVPARIPNPGTAWSTAYGPNHTSKVVLTFDDCAPTTAAFREVVDQAERLGISLVLFPYQQCRTVDASYARAHGQIVAGHSVSHANLATLSAAGVKAEIDAQSRTSGVMRPPYGAMNATVKSVLAANNIRMWTWSVDTNDWQGKTREAVVAYSINNAHAGDTVLMHMNWRAFTPQSLREMVAGLSAKGLAVCSITAGQQVVKNNNAIGQSLAC